MSNSFIVHYEKIEDQTWDNVPLEASCGQWKGEDQSTSLEPGSHATEVGLVS